MKKYYKAKVAGDDRCVIADDSSGKITLFYVRNNSHMVIEEICSTIVDPETQKSVFEYRLEFFTECTLSDIQSNLDELKTHISLL